MSKPRLLLVVATLCVVALGGFFAVRAIWHSASDVLAGEYCTFGAYQLDTDQAAVASTMVGVVIQRGLPERAAVLTLAAGLQESKLRNLASGDGDRDSVGVLQQRPSQGWGTVAQLSDVHYATGAFLDALLKVDGWQSLPLAEAIQDVQRSADGSAYAPHEGEAQAMADALTGAVAAGVSCVFDKPTLVAPATTVAAQLAADLPVNIPRATGSTVSVPAASWPTAAWFVANADRLGIDSVGYGGQQWQRSKGWHGDADAVGTSVVATLADLSK